MKLNDVRDAVEAARDRCMELAEECPASAGPAQYPPEGPQLDSRQMTMNMYTEKFSMLQAAVDGYINDTSQKAHMMRNLITSVATLVLYGAEDNIPESLWEVYSADGVFSEILGMSPSDFFDGCVMSEEEDTPTIDSLIARLESAEEKDNIQRKALNDSLFGIAMSNGHRALFEDYIHDFPEYTKRELSDIVFIEKGIREIIMEYALDVYIPSYYSQEQ